jgi:DNA-binding FadR family transcriptional regulator
MMSAVPEDKDSFRARHVTRPRAQVEEQLKGAILHGAVGQGERLPPETELARQFGISRPMLREVLGALASAGLIRKVPGLAGGNFVNSATPESLAKMLSDSMSTILRLGSLSVGEITEVRRLLETPAARSAAAHISPAEVAALNVIVERQRLTAVDDPQIAGYELEFHTAIGRASGNRLLAAFVSAVHAVADLVGLLRITPEVGRATVRQHVSILTAVAAGDAAGAAEAMSQHLDYVLCHSSNPSPIEDP